MFQELVARAAALIREHYRKDPPAAATEDALAVLQQRSRAELNADPPEEYLNFLRVTDGLNWDGLFLYGTDDNPKNSFVEQNLDWRSYEKHNSYLIFGDGDISLYAYNLIEKRYELQDRSSGTVLETFETFDALAAEALRPYVETDENNDDSD